MARVSKKRQFAQPAQVVKPTVVPHFTLNAHLSPRELGKWGLLILLFFTPLLFLPSDAPLNNPFDTPRRLLLQCGAGLLVGLLLHMWASEGRLRWRWHLLDIPVALFVLGLLVSAFLGAYPRNSLLAPVWVDNTIATLDANIDPVLPLLLTGAVLYLAARALLQTREDVEYVAARLVVAGGIVALIGLCDRARLIRLNPEFSGSRLFGTLGNPMFTGTYLAMLIPLGVALAIITTDRRWRAALGACVLLMGLGLALTLTRGAWIACAVALPLCAALLAWRARDVFGSRKRQWLLTAALLIGVMVLSLACSPQIRQRLLALSSGHDLSVQTRALFMHTAVIMFKARPVHGWGPGTFPALFPQYRPETALRQGGISLNSVFCTALPHNLLLQLAAELGMCGLLPFALLMVFLCVSGIRLLVGQAPRLAWLACGLLGAEVAYLLANLVAYDDAVTLSLFWALLGLLAAVPAQEGKWLNRTIETPQLDQRIRRGLTLAGAVMSVLTVLYVGGQVLAAVNLGAAERRIAQSDKLALPDALHACRGAEVGMRSALALAWFPTSLQYRQLMMAYKAEAAVANRLQDAEGEKAAQQAMLTAGHRGLQLFDRDPYLLGSMAMIYLNEQRPADARRYLQRLLVCQPHSADAHLFYAELLSCEGNTAEAKQQLSRVLQLDDTFGEAYARLAQQNTGELTQLLMSRIPGRTAHALLVGHDPQGSALVTDICAQYASALRWSFPLSKDDELSYATALFLAGKNAQAIEQSRLLAGTPGIDILCSRLAFFYGQQDRLQSAQPLVKQLRELQATREASP